MRQSVKEQPPYQQQCSGEPVLYTNGYIDILTEYTADVHTGFLMLVYRAGDALIRDEVNCSVVYVPEGMWSY